MCCWLPVAGLVVGFTHTDAGAPISATFLPRNSRPSHQSLIGLNAARPTIRTATTAQTTTMVSPRRRSAAFCWGRICSTTFSRSLRRSFEDLDDLAMGACSLRAAGSSVCRTVMVRAILRSERSQPNSGRVAALDPPPVGVRRDAGRPECARVGGGDQDLLTLDLVEPDVGTGPAEKGDQRLAQVGGANRAAESGPGVVG